MAERTNTANPGPAPVGGPGVAARSERLAKALRANLARRKARKRQRADADRMDGQAPRGD